MNFRHLAHRYLSTFSFAFALTALPSGAQADLFKSGWVLDGGTSSLDYEVVLNNTTVDTHTLSGLEGMIDADGLTEISIDLASISTHDDLLDTRMRYVMFETFRVPKATIGAKLDEGLLAALDDLPSYDLDLTFTLDFHGVKKELRAEAIATMLDDKTVSVRSVEPILIRAKDFRFNEGLQKLQEAYFGEASSFASVSFDFVFTALPHTEAPVIVAEADNRSAEQIVNGRSTALEADDVCSARLNALSGTRSLQFKNGSHQLSSDSLIVLADVANVIRPCQALKITVAGHTDAVGDAAYNTILSVRRADHVTDYLIRLGLPETRVFGEGYGEDRPIAPNDTAENRRKNRRIEFRVEGS